MNIGIALKDIRISKGMSQATLSQLTGVSQAQISQMEGKNKRVGEKTLQRLSAGLGVSVGFLYAMCLGTDDLPKSWSQDKIDSYNIIIPVIKQLLNQLVL